MWIIFYCFTTKNLKTLFLWLCNKEETQSLGFLLGKQHIANNLNLPCIVLNFFIFQLKLHVVACTHKWLSRMLTVKLFFPRRKMNSFNLLLFSILINFENRADSLSGGFVYRGNVSYSDVSLMISDLSLRYCAAECFKILDCHAVEICSVPTGSGNTCLLSRTISRSLVTGLNTCTHYEMVRCRKFYTATINSRPKALLFFHFII